MRPTLMAWAERCFANARRLYTWLSMVLFFCPVLLNAQQRELNWPSVSVTAHLDADGRLEVSERQVMRFTGDWNGGERRFNLRSGQSLDFTGMSRVDMTTNTSTPMTEGDLATVNHFDWSDSQTLRWRSRLPSDPEYDHTLIGFVLNYSYRNILVPQNNGGYTLDHDFGFPERDGSIEHFSVELTLDSVWHSDLTVPNVYTRDNVAPGESFTITLPLTYHGAGAPAAVLRGASPIARMALAPAFIVVILGMLAALIARENKLGRFAPLPAQRDITAEWLQANVFTLLPEVAGAAWDDRTSAAEVAAILARMVQEGKLSSRVESTKGFFGTRSVLHLTMKVDRSKFSEHERALINALFTSGGTQTNTDAVRKRYRTTGFNPAEIVRTRLERMVENTTQGAPGTKPTRLVTVVLLILAAAIVIAGSIDRPTDIAAAAIAIGVSIPCYLMALGFAAAWRHRVDRFFTLSILALVPLAAMVFVVGAVFMWQGTMRVGVPVLVGMAAWYIALINSVLNMARSRQSAERIYLRKQLTAARNYFRLQLAAREPKLQDAWFPYLIAFGLGKHIDRWFKAFGGDTHGIARSSTIAGYTSSSTGSTGASGSGSGWTGFGGGGGFSGAGGGASFAAAVGGMAASVPAPSSSSSSGGGSSSSSSGGSSGGGGGGGW